MWRRVSGYGDGYVPRSLLEQQIVIQHVIYEWTGGEPDPAQLPEGYRQLPDDRTRARRSLQPAERLVRWTIGLLAACVTILVLGSL